MNYNVYSFIHSIRAWNPLAGKAGYRLMTHNQQYIHMTPTQLAEVDSMLPGIVDAYFTHTPYHASLSELINTTYNLRESASALRVPCREATGMLYMMHIDDISPHPKKADCLHITGSCIYTIGEPPGPASPDTRVASSMGYRDTITVPFAWVEEHYAGSIPGIEMALQLGLGASDMVNVILAHKLLPEATVVLPREVTLSEIGSTTP